MKSWSVKTRKLEKWNLKCFVVWSLISKLPSKATTSKGEDLYRLDSISDCRWVELRFSLCIFHTTPRKENPVLNCRSSIQISLTKKNIIFLKMTKICDVRFVSWKKNVLRIYIGLENQILRSFFMENNIHYRHVIYIM